MRTPKYFCENCGAEVKRDAKICPECGRFFASVKCPQCGHIGQPEEFGEGCPVCGYSDPSKAQSVKIVQKQEVTVAEKGAESQSLPFWTYLLAFLGLCVVLILLAYSIK
jgi:uncharacterized membrane protein YvbJ